MQTTTTTPYDVRNIVGHYDPASFLPSMCSEDLVVEQSRTKATGDWQGRAGLYLNLAHPPTKVCS
jgi:hypothetical protein